ncbi:extracellular solute-binding protein [Streptomyces cinereoruber]|uniref:extracellular solute-binding protein n=1 Tax=Streptomyces cinereoruber TaxID=67260 RepID=UPI00363BFADB
MRRTLAAAIATVVLTTGLTACSETPATAPVTITWWDTSDAKNEAPTYKALVKEFEKTHPGIKVTYVNVPFADAQTKFQKAAAAKQAPDVLRADVGWTPGLAQAGFLTPLNDTPAEPDDVVFQEELIEQATYDGKIYGAPQVTDTLALMYNKDLFAQAGITHAPDSWQELKRDMAKIKEKTGSDGFAFNPQAYFAMPFLFGEGTDLVDADYKLVTVNSDASVKGMTTLAELLQAPGARKLDTTNKAYANIMDAFSNGKVAAIIQGPWETANLFKSKAFTDPQNLGIAPVPKGSAGRGAPLGGHNLVASTGTDPARRNAAHTFIAYMTSVEAQEKVAIANGTLPTRVDAYTGDVLFKPEIAEYHAALKEGVPRQPIPEYTALYAAMEPHLIGILTGRTTSRAGLDAISEAALRLLPDYRKP